MSTITTTVTDEQWVTLMVHVMRLYRDVHERLGDGEWNAGARVKALRIKDTGLLAIFSDYDGHWYFRDKATAELTAARVDDFGQFEYGAVGMDGRIRWVPNHTQN
jgi:hypothetical protein